jgi:gluconate:H+ symporter, GntP family
MSTGFILIAFALSIVLMIVLISKFKVHPAMSILIAVILLGFAIGTPPEKVVGTINQGFADTIKSIAIVIFLGCVLGKVLEETGAAVSITKTIVKLFGKKNVIWAIAASAGILGIPVFADSVVILLIPIVSVLAIETGASMMSYGGALYLGALVTASLVPPTPGPVAAAALLKVPLGQSIIWGLIVSIPSIIAGVIYLKRLKTPVLPKEEYIKAAKEAVNQKLPSTTKSLVPIVVPLILIMLNTLIATKFPKTTLASAFAFIGDPLPALLIGCFTSMILVGPTWKTKKVLNDWIEDSVKCAAMPIIVTGLGGALAIFIKNAKIAEQIAEGVAGTAIPGILIPIVMAAIIHVITGSNALGVMTAAALVEPMLGILGVSPLAAFLACGTGALMFKHSNSSGFWVTTSMSNMTLTQGLISVGGFSTVAGATGAVVTIILHSIGVI